jgi:hypothetical protein
LGVPNNGDLVGPAFLAEALHHILRGDSLTEETGLLQGFGLIF